MLSCTDCGRSLDKAEPIACKSCIFKEIDVIKSTRNKLEAEVAELKDAIHLAIIDEPDKMTIIRGNTQKLNELAKDLTDQSKEQEIKQQQIFDEQRKLHEQKLASLKADNEAKITERKASLKMLILQQTGKKNAHIDELAAITTTVGEQRELLLGNIKLCFKISMTKINNFIGMAPDDLNAVLGHVAQITVHISKIFRVALPFDLVPNMPITYFRLGSDKNDRLLLWMNSQDPTGRTLSKFVTAVALLNFCITWLASAAIPADQVDSWNGLRNFWAIINGWSADMQLHRPSASLPQVFRETFFSWNLHTGDNIALSIPVERLSTIMRVHTLETI